MNRTKFVNSYLEKLISKDEDIRAYFDPNDRKSYDKLRKELGLSLGESYDDYARGYFSSMGLARYLSTFLRYGGATADLLGTYLFWVGGGAGFLFKLGGASGKSLADVIDMTRFMKYAERDERFAKVKDEILAGGEGLIERIAAYFPVGIGELADLARGNRKFDNKIVNYALKKAKYNFLERVKGERGKIVSLDRFRNPRYESIDDAVDAGKMAKAA